ncbi:Transposase domain containing protein [Oopsacas minuta]|uniref:Transposase domain containing protein n=1 Tax=Oopsacas minuta TaxID=111878 RepID=A0AAV7K7E7_9METZ|nr:Transposase domain containing protein [Oopsacas minuta]
MVGCSQKSVAEILKKHRLTGSVRDFAIPCRPRVTTKRQDNLLVRKCKKDRFKTATQIKAEVLSEYSIKLSTSTVQRRLRGAGLFGRKPRKKPRLTTKHKRDRLSFARSHKNWNTEEWARVVFSDESRFLLYTNDGRAYIRRMKGEEISERCLQKTCKFGGGGIMVCGCFCWSGVGLWWKYLGTSRQIPTLIYWKMH